MRPTMTNAETDAGHIDLAVDREGNRYTTHAFGFDGDPWRGATILTPSVVRGLRKRGMLPLTECVLPPDVSATPLAPLTTNETREDT